MSNEDTLPGQGGRATAQADAMPDFGGVAPARALSPDLEMILDIPVRLSMEVGNTQISIRDLLQLGQGSVIELDRLAGEPLDVLVNGTLIRMTDVISPSERIKKLG